MTSSSHLLHVLVLCVVSDFSLCSLISQAKLRKAYNWYQSRTLVTESELCKKRENVEVNAYFTPRLCIMMEPFILMDPHSFDAELPKIWNYAIHSVLSHELGHGFDPLAVYEAGIGEYDSINRGAFFSLLHYGEVVVGKCHIHIPTYPSNPFENTLKEQSCDLMKNVQILEYILENSSGIKKNPKSL